MQVSGTSAGELADFTADGGMATTLINLYGAPAAGKTTKMVQLCATAKLAGLYCEPVTEVAKEYAAGGTPMTPQRQIDLTTEQHRRLGCFLGHVDYIVSDAPMLIGAYYAGASGWPEAQGILELCKAFEKDVQSRCRRTVHLFLERCHPYCGKGRYQDETVACEMHLSMRQFMEKNLLGATLVPITSTELPEAIWKRCVGDLPAPAIVIG
jgi:hypothetical protein